MILSDVLYCTVPPVMMMIIIITIPWASCH